MALQSGFLWGQGGRPMSASDIARERAIAEALMKRDKVATNPWEGISQVAGSVSGALMRNRADEAEQTQREAASEAYQSLFADDDLTLQELSGAMGNEFMNSGQSAVIQALMGQKVQQQDPLYQQNLERGGIELEQMRNPAWEAPDLEETFDPETGRPVKGYMTPEGFEPVGGVAAPKDPLVTVNTGDMAGEGKAFYEALDKDNAAMFSTLQSDGLQAGQSLVKIGQLDNLLGQIDTGAGAAFSQIAGNFGIESEGLNEIQAAQAIINQLVPAQRPPGSGPMSDADLELFKQSMPRLINQTGGNRLIIDTMRGIAEYTAAQGAIADKVANREITPAEGRKALAELPNPLENIEKAAKNSLPEGVTEEDMQFTMEKHGLTRAEVLERLNAK